MPWQNNGDDMSSYVREIRDSGVNSLEDINEARIRAGLEPFREAKRKCIKCEKFFMSMAPQFRRCSDCSLTKEAHLAKSRVPVRSRTKFNQWKG